MFFLKLKVTIIIILVVLIVCTSLLNVIGLICPFGLSADSEEAPIVTVRKNDLLCTKISQIVSDDENIYVLFGQYGVVQAYTLDGRYRYSIAVYDHLNGRTEIAVWNRSLLICDKIGNVYVFDDGEITQFLDYKESRLLQREVPFGAWDPEYAVHWGSVWYEPYGKEGSCMIHRPAWLAFYQNDAGALIQIMLIIMIGIVLSFPQPGKKQK